MVCAKIVKGLAAVAGLRLSQFLAHVALPGCSGDHQGVAGFRRCSLPGLQHSPAPGEGQIPEGSGVVDAC